MKKIIALVATLACMNVMANDMTAVDTSSDCICEDADLFEGLTAELALGYAYNTNEDIPTKSNLTGKEKLKLGRFAALLGTAYRYNMGNGWYVGGGADVTFSSKKKTQTIDGQNEAEEILVNSVLKTLGVNQSVSGERVVNGKVKIKQLTVSPELFLSLGKSFANNYLVEVLAGGTYAGAKLTTERMTLTNKKNQNSPVAQLPNGSVKVKKFVPVVGLKGSYAINQNISVGATVKYAFNVKKNDLSLKKNFSVLLGLAYRF